jgi:hypothetical protein
MSNNPEPQHLADCKALTATKLRRKYSTEANSHRNMLQRAPGRGNIIHPEFRVFRDFLLHVGPRLCLGATLDRIDNTDPEYALGKVRWADKRTQNSNKGDTRLFHYSRMNDTYTVSQLAKRQGVRPSTIRQRFARGWTDDEIIEGKKHDVPVNFEPNHRVSAPRDHKHPHVQPEHLRPARDIMWERRAASVAHHRETEGQEYCLCDYETLAEAAAEVGAPISKEGYELKFAKWWVEYEPHLIRKDLPEWAQELIARIEGTTLAEIHRYQDECGTGSDVGRGVLPNVTILKEPSASLVHAYPNYPSSVKTNVRPSYGLGGACRV